MRLRTKFRVSSLESRVYMNQHHFYLRTVLFDLDGTLADTAPDLASALNTLRMECAKPPLPFETIRPVVSHGSTALVKLGFDEIEGNPAFDRLRQRFLDIYQC